MDVDLPEHARALPDPVRALVVSARRARSRAAEHDALAATERAHGEQLIRALVHEHQLSRRYVARLIGLRSDGYVRVIVNKPTPSTKE